jgi:hypothetical protein
MRHFISRMEKADETDAYIDVDVLNNHDKYRANDGIVTHCTAYALYEDVLAGNWMLKVNFGKHDIIRPDSCAWVSVCEYDKSMSIPIAGEASPRIFDVVCQTDKVVIRGSTNLKTPCLRLNIMVKRAQDYIPPTAFGTTLVHQFVSVD